MPHEDNREILKPLMLNLMDALNGLGNKTTDPEHELTKALKTLFFRYRVNPAPEVQRAGGQVETTPERKCPHVPHDPDAPHPSDMDPSPGTPPPRTQCEICGAEVSNDPKTGLWCTQSGIDAPQDATRPDFAARLAWLEMALPANTPIRKEGWQPPEEPGRWLMICRNPHPPTVSAGVYEELAKIAEVIDLMHPQPVQIDVADLDERKLYQPERKTVAFVSPGSPRTGLGPRGGYQPNRAVESRIEIE